MIKKIIIGVIWTIGCIVLGVKLAEWKNLGPNKRPTDERSWLSIIYDDSKHQHVVLKSMEHDFDVHYVKNAKPNCFNPYFPAVYIVATGTYDRWLHIIRTTDCRLDQCYAAFIDTWPEGYPFYTWGQSFSDAPIITYGLMYKPWSSWVGHVYAVQVDEENKTIQCVGGISWGYQLPWWSLRPVMILPSALTENDWQTDWNVFETALPGYKNIKE